MITCNLWSSWILIIKIFRALRTRFQNLFFYFLATLLFSKVISGLLAIGTHVLLD